MKKLNKFPPLKCPHCKESLDDGDIYDTFLVKYGGDEEKALEVAGYYGWTKDNPKRFSKILGIYSLEKDCIEFWQCPFCEKEISEPPKNARPRGTKIKELVDDDV